MPTPILDIGELVAQQSQPHVTVNEAFRRIEALLIRVLSRTNGGPPGSPSDGDSYIVDDASGDWSGFALDDIAWHIGGTWYSWTPVEGAEVWVNDEDTPVRFNSGSWTAGGANNFAGLGDTPSSYSGAARKMAVVNAGETGLEFAGLGMPVQEKTGDYTVALSDHGQQIAVTDTTSARTITLPAAATGGAGFTIGVYLEDATNTVTIDADGTELIDAAETLDLTNGGDGVLLVCTGSKWRTIASQITPSGAGTGDVTGPASSQDNELPRFDGTGGDTLQKSGVLIDDDGNLYGHGQRIDFKASDFTLASADAGKNLDVATGSAATVTVPTNANVALPVGYSVGIVQADGNTITLSPQSGVTIRSKGGNTSTNGQWSAVTLYKRATDEWVLIGDLAA